MSEMVPKIRFSSFTDDWEQRKLGDIMNVTSVKRIHQSDWTDSGIRFLRARDIVAAFKNEKQTEYLYISIEKYKEYSKISGKVSPGDLLVTGVGSIGVPMLVTDEEPIYFKDGNIIWFKNESKIEGYFFYYSFINNKIQKYIRDVAGTGTVGTYTIDSGKKTPIVLPNYEEQAKIGSFFKRLDDLITLHQRKLDLLKEQKKGFLQKMFPKNGSRVPELRFSGFADDWEERKLTDVTYSYSGLTYSPTDVQDKGTFVLRSSNVKNDQLIDADNVYVNPDVVNSNNVKVGDVIVVVRNGSRSLIGKHAIVTKEMPHTVIGAFMSAFRGENGDYINALLSTNNFQKEVHKSLGATINQITGKDFSMMNFLTPKLEEQNKIGSFFKQLDNTIALHQRKLELLKEQKKGFLQKMFVS